MKYSFLLFFIPFITNGQLLPTQDQSQVKDTSGIEWIKTTHEFGEIPQGVPASHVFKFVNKSKFETEITFVEASCGCTQPDWTKTKIKPLDSAFVKGTFNAQSSGMFKKQITVYTNRSPFPNYLFLQGNVKPKN